MRKASALDCSSFAFHWAQILTATNSKSTTGSSSLFFFIFKVAFPHFLPGTQRQDWATFFLVRRYCFESIFTGFRQRFQDRKFISSNHFSVVLAESKISFQSVVVKLANPLRLQSKIYFAEQSIRNSVLVESAFLMSRKSRPEIANFRSGSFRLDMPKNSFLCGTGNCRECFWS